MGEPSKYIFLKTALAKARQDKSLTQAEVALRLGRPQSFISKYECGERNLDVVEFVEVCRALSVDPQILIRQMEDNDAS
jgi:transcriptional regulator with XRE-family HTH domain